MERVADPHKQIAWFTKGIENTYYNRIHIGSQVKEVMEKAANQNNESLVYIIESLFNI